MKSPRERVNRRGLLQSKVLNIVLLLAVVSLPFVILPASTFSAWGLWGPIVRQLASAILTTALVGLFFEMFTRIEVKEMFQSVTEESENRIISTLTGANDPDSRLFESLWGPFVRGESKLLIAEEELVGSIQKDVVARIADIVAAFELYSFLVNKVLRTLSCRELRIQIATLEKESFVDASLPNGNLIVIGAPGANPAADNILRQVYGITNASNGNVERFVFIVDRNREYLVSPFIVPTGNPDEIGIAQYASGGINRKSLIRRKFNDNDPFGKQHDAALILSANLPDPLDATRRVLLFGGHSRKGTVEAVRFAVTNRDWLERMMRDHAGKNTVSLLRIDWQGGAPETKLVDIFPVIAKSKRGSVQKGARK